uniref:Uncharacterized protein n=1 Tax=Anguilla anguilla TaxID=7936 RepID=A0A0E9VVL7_ANGAN
MCCIVGQLLHCRLLLH